MDGRSHIANTGCLAPIDKAMPSASDAVNSLEAQMAAGAAASPDKSKHQILTS